MAEKLNPAPLGGIGKKHWLAFIVVCVAAYALFVHVDVLETGNHSYVFLDSLFTGRLGDFYEVIVSRPTNLYYLNYANYNVVVYLLYGIVELPYYIVIKLMGSVPNEFVLQYLAKLVALVFHFGCVWLVALLGIQAGFEKNKAAFAALAYGLATPAFFSGPIMGQYDSVCLFFILLSLLYYLRGKMWAFVLCAGFGMVFKFFCAFIFIPLLLLKEKRILRILIYGIASLWLIIPTTLPFIGRNGGQNDFLDIMVSRIFQEKFHASFGVSLFLLCFFFLCVLCWLWRPEDIAKTAFWVGLCVFGIFFLFVPWHPQWVALICPFIALTSASEKRGDFWLLNDIAFSLGFLGIICTAYPGHFGDNLFDLGFWGAISGIGTLRPNDAWTLAGQLAKFPVLFQFCTVLFFGIIILNIVLKFPSKKGSLLQRYAYKEILAGKASVAKLWAVFGLCMGGWFLLILFLWVRRVVGM